MYPISSATPADSRVAPTITPFFAHHDIPSIAASSAVLPDIPCS